MHMPLPSSNVKAARLAFFMALIAWTMFAGKDVSWDVVRHQLYPPFLWLSGHHAAPSIGTWLTSAWPRIHFSIQEARA